MYLVAVLNEAHRKETYDVNGVVHGHIVTCHVGCKHGRLVYVVAGSTVQLAKRPYNSKICMHLMTHGRRVIPLKSKNT